MYSVGFPDNFILLLPPWLLPFTVTRHRSDLDLRMRADADFLWCKLISLNVALLKSWMPKVDLVAII
jgi:hypothetical protein